MCSSTRLRATRSSAGVSRPPPIGAARALITALSSSSNPANTTERESSVWRVPLTEGRRPEKEAAAAERTGSGRSSAWTETNKWKDSGSSSIWPCKSVTLLFKTRTLYTERFESRYLEGKDLSLSLDEASIYKVLLSVEVQLKDSRSWAEEAKLGEEVSVDVKRISNVGEINLHLDKVWKK